MAHKSQNTRSKKLKQTTITPVPFPVPHRPGCSDNPRSNRPERRTALVARELTRYKVDIAGLSETRFSEQGQLEVGAGYTFFSSGRPKAERRDAGVAFVIRNDIVGLFEVTAASSSSSSSSSYSSIFSFAYMLNAILLKEMPAPRMQERTGRLLLIGGCMLEDSSENATCEVDELDPRTGNWAALEAMMARRTYGHTATTVRVEGQQGVKDEEVIVVCGGRDEQENALASCELYVPPENFWYKLPDMQKKRSWTAAAALPDGRLFLFGGVGSNNSVEFCCLRDWRTARSSTTDAFWREAAPMNWCSEERYGLAATAFRQDIIVAGGAPKNEQAVQVFHPPAYAAIGEDALGQWTRLEQQKLNKERVVFSLLVHRGRIFALGSCFSDPAAQNSVEEFVPTEDNRTGTWKSGFESWKWVERPVPKNISKIWNATVA
ncbi:unnamed protein product [Schistocephalus solidus]|uniref:Kelch-like protein 18 n=1 Tax=Schistocephalus solidus TaxID=70667 RepID=A0A183SXN9_SCHSO|nr:unnamed protein product [Schistocephalus solidus]